MQLPLLQIPSHVHGWLMTSPPAWPVSLQHISFYCFCLCAHMLLQFDLISHSSSQAASQAFYNKPWLVPNVPVSMAGAKKTLWAPFCPIAMEQRNPGGLPIDSPVSRMDSSEKAAGDAQDHFREITEGWLGGCLPFPTGCIQEPGLTNLHSHTSMILGINFFFSRLQCHPSSWRTESTPTNTIGCAWLNCSQSDSGQFQD